ncbi:MAG: cobalt ECF transporter T component CbiQ [Oscillospiraceae bacterium]|jgi:cobalt/nickel transport system permease protein|nr:cobalt ECF transporter T component CbiQ [Oscillospiraceae bacterium]
MNKMEKALGELGAMDELASQDSPVHRLNAAAKLLSTIAYIITVMSFGKYQLSGLIPMLLWPVLLFQISGIRVSTCFYKLRIVLPLVMAVGLFNPIFDRHILLRIGGLAVSGGVVSMITLMLKGVLCLMMSFLLVATTPFDTICAAMRQMHVPKTLVTLLLLTYRYVGVMTEELAIMTDAYHLRAPGQKGIHVSAWGSFLGQLLLRSMDRAQELYSSMLLRGYHQHFHYAPVRPFRTRDALYLMLSVGLFIALRLVDAAQLLGHVFVR